MLAEIRRSAFKLTSKSIPNLQILLPLFHFHLLSRLINLQRLTPSAPLHLACQSLPPLLQLLPNELPNIRHFEALCPPSLNLRLHLPNNLIDLLLRIVGHAERRHPLNALDALERNAGLAFARPLLDLRLEPGASGRLEEAEACDCADDGVEVDAGPDFDA